uniref:Uncharacterized protein n=1 Tax=Parastrongyloides trichosuri TaxID=131310 RepID=A0A0N4ZR51_PARTI
MKLGSLVNPKTFLFSALVCLFLERFFVLFPFYDGYNESIEKLNNMDFTYESEGRIIVNLLSILFLFDIFMIMSYLFNLLNCGKEIQLYIIVAIGVGLCWSQLFVSFMKFIYYKGIQKALFLFGIIVQFTFYIIHSVYLILACVVQYDNQERQQKKTRHYEAGITNSSTNGNENTTKVESLTKTPTKHESSEVQNSKLNVETIP